MSEQQPVVDREARLAVVIGIYSADWETLAPSTVKAWVESGGRLEVLTGNGRTDLAQLAEAEARHTARKLRGRPEQLARKFRNW